MPFTPKLSMREEVFMILRRLGFPIEVCDLIISKGALRGHLPMFSAVGKYVWDETELRLFTTGKMEITYDPIIDGHREYEVEVGRDASLMRCFMELSYGGYYEEILEEKGIVWMNEDCLDRFLDSVSGEENKTTMENYLLMIMSQILGCDTFFGHSPNHPVIRMMCKNGCYTRYTNMPDWRGMMTSVWGNTYMMEHALTETYTDADNRRIEEILR